MIDRQCCRRLVTIGIFNGVNKHISCVLRRHRVGISHILIRTISLQHQITVGTFNRRVKATLYRSRGISTCNTHTNHCKASAISSSCIVIQNTSSSRHRQRRAFYNGIAIQRRYRRIVCNIQAHISSRSVVISVCHNHRDCAYVLCKI